MAHSELIDRQWFRNLTTGQIGRVSVFPDSDSESPRGWDNVSALVTDVRDYRNPDEGSDVSDFLPYGDFDWTARRAELWLSVFSPDVLAWRLLTHDGQGLTTYGPGDMHRDDDVRGVAVVTRDNWERAFGTDYAGDTTPLQVIEQEVATYNEWANGEVTGHTAEVMEEIGPNANWAEVDSCWGHFGGSDYALTYGQEESFPADTWEQIDKGDAAEALAGHGDHDCPFPNDCNDFDL